jgi:pyrroline-5-carboxylate reductase
MTGFIGGGNMAEALIKGLISSGSRQGSEVIVSDIREERLKELAGRYGVMTTSDNGQVVEQSDIVVLCVKPQNMDDVLESLRDSVTSDKLVVSIAAGVTISRITDVLGDIPVVRAMPNTPALIGQGVSGFTGNKAAEGRMDKACAVLSSCGLAVEIAEEGLLDAVTAVSGSGPAYFFLLMEEMIKAGIEQGLCPEVSRQLVVATAKGAGLLADSCGAQGDSPAELRKKVTSPGGTTAAAVSVFMDAKLNTTVSQAIAKAAARSRELSGS